jgi:alpha-ketoglutarate-dependent taurine dioxygenase
MSDFMVVGATIEDVERDPGEFIDIFREFGIVAFRGMNISNQEKDPLRVLDAFSDRLSWTPRPHGDIDSWGYLQQYDDLLQERQPAVDEDMIQWHVEGISKRKTQRAAGWYMYKFNGAPQTGSTGFVDMAKMVERIPENLIDAARSTRVHHFPPFPSDSQMYEKFIGDVQDGHDPVWLSVNGREVGAFSHPSIEQHPDFDFDVVRLCPCGEWFGRQHFLHLYDNELPSADQKDVFYRFYDWVCHEIHLPENQTLWHWEEGDFLVPDLFRMAHGVKGGIVPGQRYFQGFWCFPHGTPVEPEIYSDDLSAMLSS